MCKDAIKQRALQLGFDACGMAAAEPVSADAVARYDRWIAEGGNDCMDYAERYQDVRSDVALLLPGAKTVISLAINYFPSEFQRTDVPQIAYYAYGNDYHEVVRQKLTALAAFIEETTGAATRICVDTAPIREKYWAQKAGIGFVGRNNLLIIPQRGSYFFLGEIVTTLELPPDKPCAIECGACQRCVEACPGGALSADGSAVDARRCLSCQLIERRGDLPDWVAQAQGNRLYGCDECQRACPHNAHAKPTREPQFAPRQEILNLTADDIAQMDQSQFSRIFAHSAIKRAKLAGLQRNLRTSIAPNDAAPAADAPNASAEDTNRRGFDSE